MAVVAPTNRRILSQLLSKSVRSVVNGQEREVLRLVELGEGAMRQFNVGDVVNFIPDLFLRSAARGDYRILAPMPDRDGHHMYRIKSPLEEHDRAVKESLLIKSDGHLPEEAPKKCRQKKSITLPTLHVVSRCIS